jgi:DNA polymerase elongation subunit (family B)
MVFNENNCFLLNDINIDFSNKNYIQSPSWDLIDSPQFKTITTDIYKNLLFNNTLICSSNNFIQTLNVTDNTNVNIIHLRLENDAIEFWSTENKLSNRDFYYKLTEKYINLITNLIDKNDKTIILTYNTKNDVIEYLKKNNYNYFIQHKLKNNNREVNAIIDILNSKYCNNVFIAVGGSTFSWTINKLISPRIISWIDINNV